MKSTHPRIQLPLYLLLLALAPQFSIFAAGGLDPGFNVGTGAEDDVQTLAVQTNGQIIAAGLFFDINGTPNSLGIARLNTNGSVDAAFNPGTSVDFGISSVAVQPDGKIIIGGGFTMYQGMSRNGIARINVDGTLDTGFTPGTGVNDIINSVALQSDGKVIIAGAFTVYNGTNRNGIARVNTNGTLDLTFNPGTGLDFAADSVLVQSDNQILLAGGFVHYNGTQRRGVARINSADGSLDMTFDPGASVDNLVRVVSVQPDGKAIIGGDFATFNAVSRNGIARLSLNGTLDTSFNPGAGANGSIYSLAIQPNGKVIAAGSFTTMAGVARSRIARLLPNGALDGNFGAGADNTILAAALQPDGKVVIGGQFESVNAASSVRLARLLVSDPQQPSAITAIVRSASSATLTWSSLSNQIYRVDYRPSLSAASWTGEIPTIIATNSSTSFSDNAPDPAARFYRVAQLPY
jgi:uncharacterized delta-60 repeat protein